MIQELFNQVYNYISTQLTHNEFAIGAALAGIGAALWTTLRGIPLKIWRRVHRFLYFSMTIEQEDPMFKFLDLWIQKNLSKQLRQVEAYTEDDQLVLSHQNDYVFMWRNYRRIKISKTKEKIDGAMYSVLYRRSYTISGLFARKVIINLMEDIYKEGNEELLNKQKTKKEIDIYTISKYGSFVKQSKTTKPKTFKQIYLANKDILIEDLKQFRSKQDLYDILGIPFKRGYLLHGKPGNGKSATAFAIAEDMKYDIYVMDLATVKADEFIPLLNSIPPNSLVLIEDIDNFYNKRTPSKDNKINFSTFLNSLSGVAQKDRIITVITTNNIDAIDAALIRPGRCDVVLELDNPTKQLAEQYLSNIFSTTIELESYNEQISFVSLQEIVVSNIDNLEKIKSQICVKIKNDADNRSTGSTD